MNQSNQLTVAAIILSAGLIVAAVLMKGSFSPEGPSTKTFNVIMENNRYSPSELVANMGDAVIINFENRDAMSHAVAIPEFNGTVPNGHIPANGNARMEFVANRVVATDAAVCGGANPTDRIDDHGERLIFRVI